ncbi:hypothetical protein LMIY3S_04518 [Labrys miyagiensis]
MSFGTEIKDFINAFQTGMNMGQQSQRIDLERQKLKAQTDYLAARQAYNDRKAAQGAQTTVDPATQAGLDAEREFRQRTGSTGSSGQASATSSGPGESNVLLDAVALGESGSGQNYDKVFADGKFGVGGKPVSQMTINQAIDLADRIRRNPANVKYDGTPTNAGPVGRYQFVASTLRGLRDQMGLTGNEQFSPAMQDRLAWQNLKNTNGNPELIRKQWVSWAGKSDADIRRLWDEGMRQHQLYTENADSTGNTVASTPVTSTDLPSAGQPQSAPAPTSNAGREVDPNGRAMPLSMSSAPTIDPQKTAATAPRLPTGDAIDYSLPTRYATAIPVPTSVQPQDIPLNEDGTAQAAQAIPLSPSWDDQLDLNGVWG